jgi:N-dimethylarginine dimethylaminohydrolase
MKDFSPGGKDGGNDEKEGVMGDSVGVRSSVGRLERVAVRPPSRVGDYLGAHWVKPDLDLLEQQHRDFANLLRSLGAGVEELEPVDGMPDGIFVYDPVFVAGEGAIVLRAAKAARVPENAKLASDLEAFGVPIIGRLTEPAFADGGDMLFLDHTTLAIGLTYRTNEAGAEQIRTIVAPQGISVITFDMPRGPSRPCQYASLPIPHGATTPRPVMATR